MAFRLPSFNLSANVWRGNVDCTSAPPASTVGCNLSPGKRVFQAPALFIPPASTVATLAMVPMVMELLVPALTDLRYRGNGAGFFDSIEVPAGSGRFYACIFVDDIGKGFSNEHRFALLLQPAAGLAAWLNVAASSMPQWPTPYP